MAGIDVLSDAWRRLVVQIELEALKTERDGMNAGNEHSLAIGDPPVNGELPYALLAEQMRALKTQPDAE